MSTYEYNHDKTSVTASNGVTVTEVSGTGCGDSNLVGFSCCKLKKIYALYESFIYTGWGPVPGQAPALATVNLVAPAVA